MREEMEIRCRQAFEQWFGRYLATGWVWDAQDRLEREGGIAWSELLQAFYEGRVEAALGIDFKKSPKDFWAWVKSQAETRGVDWPEVVRDIADRLKRGEVKALPAEEHRFGRRPFFEDFQNRREEAEAEGVRVYLDVAARGMIHPRIRFSLSASKARLDMVSADKLAFEILHEMLPQLKERGQVEMEISRRSTEEQHEISITIPLSGYEGDDWD